MMKKWLVLFITGCGLLFMLSGVTNSATPTDPSDAGKAFADTQNSAIANSAKAPITTDIPHYEGENVDAKKYYDRGVNIEEDALVYSINDPTSTYVTDSYGSRPRFDINKNTDPLFKRDKEIVDLSRSLTETYTDCVALPVGAEDTSNISNKECFVDARQDTIDYICKKKIDAKCGNEDAGRLWPYKLSDFISTGDDAPSSQSGNTFTFGSYWNYRTGHCKYYYRTLKFFVEDDAVITDFRFDKIRYDDWLDISINGTLAFRAVGPWQGLNVSKAGKSCEMGRIYNGTPFDALKHIKKGWNTIYVANEVHGAGNYHFRITLIRRKGCDLITKTSYTCPPGENQFRGELVKSTCIDKGKRTISDVDITLPCWTWDEQYTRITPPIYSREAACDVIESQGCGQVSSSCVASGDGFCAKTRLDYECPDITAARTVDLCGNVLSCPDGNCSSEYQTKKNATDDFKKAATGLAVANEIAKDFDYTNLSVFTGEGKSCRKKKVDFANCCKDSGWGTDLGLVSCTTEEKELGVSRQQKAAHYVGSYCSQDSFLGCLTTRHVYCTYPSKLARIIVEQGNALLGRGYGTPTNPVCVGFTLDELNNLDFNAMNLSEFYTDVMANAANGTVGDPNQLVQDLAQKIQQMGGGN